MTSARKPPSRPRLAPLLSELPAATVALLARANADAHGTGDLLKRQLAVVSGLVGAKSSFVSLHDPSRRQLAIQAARGRSDAKVVAVRPGVGAVGEAFERGAVRRDPAQAMVAVPIVGDEGPIGVLALIGARVQPTDALALALGAQLAAGLRIARTRDDLTRRQRDLETAVAGLRSLDKSRDELLGDVSHELKTPLTTVKAQLGLLLRGRLGPLAAQQRLALEACDRNSDRLLRLINDLLLINRLRGGRMTLSAKPIGLRALGEEAISTLEGPAEEAGVTILAVQSPGEVYVKGDRQRLLEAVENLVDNAIRYNKPKGTVRVRLSTEGGTAVVEVEDTGVGIRKEDLPRVFERFFRSGPTRPIRTGSGLGLAIVRQIATMHGGQVSVRSAKSGTVFTLRLPLFAGAVSFDESHPRELREGAILVIEDDADCRSVMQLVLEEEGYAVVGAASRAEALDHLKWMKPALVLLDLRLSDGDGRPVLVKLRGNAATHDTPVFVMSGAVDSAAGFNNAAGDRVDGFFEKPLNLPRLLDRVRAFIRPMGASRPA